MGKEVVRVENLKVGVLTESKKVEDGYRFTINYGSFCINEGDFVLIKGKNGSGKTTFLRLFHLMGFDYFRVREGGIYFVDEQFPNKSIHEYSEDEMSKLNRNVAYVDQEDTFRSGASAYSEILRSCQLSIAGNDRLTPAEKRQKLIVADEIIKECFDKYLSKSLEIKDYKVFCKKSANAYSGGQKKIIKVFSGIITALACDYRLVIMDEPLNNLDGKNKALLNMLIKELRKKKVTIIAITHCQIFEGINKVMTVKESDGADKIAQIVETEDPPHKECLEFIEIE